jgi:hypothetical protein
MFYKTKGVKNFWISDNFTHTHPHTSTRIYTYICIYLIRLCSGSLRRTQLGRFFLFSDPLEDLSRFSVRNIVVSGLGWRTETKIPVTNSAAHFHLTVVWRFRSSGIWRCVFELVAPDFVKDGSTVTMSGHGLLDNVIFLKTWLFWDITSN